MGLQELLQYLAGAGAVAVAAAFVSLLAEHIPAFGALPAATKRALMYSVAVALGLAAWWVTRYAPPDVIAQFEEPVRLALLILGAGLSGQAWHKVVNVGAVSRVTIQNIDAGGKRVE